VKKHHPEWSNVSHDLRKMLSLLMMGISLGL